MDIPQAIKSYMRIRSPIFDGLHQRALNVDARLVCMSLRGRHLQLTAFVRRRMVPLLRKDTKEDGRYRKFQVTHFAQCRVEYFGVEKLVDEAQTSLSKLFTITATLFPAS